MKTFDSPATATRCSSTGGVEVQKKFWTQPNPPARPTRSDRMVRKHSMKPWPPLGARPTFSWVGTQGAHGIDLFRSRTMEPSSLAHPERVSARHHQAGQHGAQFTDHGERDQLAIRVMEPEALQGVRALHRQHGAGKKNRSGRRSATSPSHQVSLLIISAKYTGLRNRLATDCAVITV